jgi:hypothetical protein
MQAATLIVSCVVLVVCTVLLYKSYEKEGPIEAGVGRNAVYSPMSTVASTREKSDDKEWLSFIHFRSGGSIRKSTQTGAFSLEIPLSSMHEFHMFTNIPYHESINMKDLIHNDSTWNETTRKIQETGQIPVAYDKQTKKIVTDHPTQQIHKTVGEDHVSQCEETMRYNSLGDIFQDIYTHFINTQKPNATFTYRVGDDTHLRTTIVEILHIDVDSDGMAQFTIRRLTGAPFPTDPGTTVTDVHMTIDDFWGWLGCGACVGGTIGGILAILVGVNVATGGWALALTGALAGEIAGATGISQAAVMTAGATVGTGGISAFASALGKEVCECSENHRKDRERLECTFLPGSPRWRHVYNLSCA